MKIIRFTSNTTNTKRENKTMNNSVIALPAGLDDIMSNLVVARQTKTTYKKKNRVRVPQGPKKAPTIAARAGTESMYTDQFLNQIVKFLYDDMLSLQQITDILNSYGLKSVRGKTWTATILSGALSSWQAWAIIEPRYRKWQLENWNAK